MADSSRTLRDQLRATGIRRGRRGRTFEYRRASGDAVSPAAVARIAALRIPPAWRDVAIAASPRARVQAVGRDLAGRWQYLYRPQHVARRSRAKFDRMLAFVRALPALRAAVRADLARPGMPLERACAGAVLLMSAAALRSGAEAYARDNATFGLATLRPRHVSVRGTSVTLAFRAKHGVKQQVELRGRRLAALVREWLRMGGRELIQYQRDNGRAWDVRRSHLNAYVKRVMGRRFVARDFRTWHATLVCAGALRSERVANPSGDAAVSARKAAITRALAATAARLGNTPRVARTSYVHPAVLSAFREGRAARVALARPEALAERMPARLHPAERAVVALIERRERGGER